MAYFRLTGNDAEYKAEHARQADMKAEDALTLWMHAQANCRNKTKRFTVFSSTWKGHEVLFRQWKDGFVEMLYRDNFLYTHDPTQFDS